MPGKPRDDRTHGDRKAGDHRESSGVDAMGKQPCRGEHDHAAGHVENAAENAREAAAVGTRHHAGEVRVHHDRTTHRLERAPTEGGAGMCGACRRPGLNAARPSGTPARRPTERPRRRWHSPPGCRRWRSSARSRPSVLHTSGRAVDVVGGCGGGGRELRPDPLVAAGVAELGVDRDTVEARCHQPDSTTLRVPMDQSTSTGPERPARPPRVKRSSSARTPPRHDVVRRVDL